MCLAYFLNIMRFTCVILSFFWLLYNILLLMDTWEAPGFYYYKSHCYELSHGCLLVHRFTCFFRYMLNSRIAWSQGIHIISSRRYCQRMFQNGCTKCLHFYRWKKWGFGEETLTKNEWAEPRLEPELPAFQSLVLFPARWPTLLPYLEPFK